MRIIFINGLNTVANAAFIAEFQNLYYINTGKKAINLGGHVMWHFLPPILSDITLDSMNMIKFPGLVDYLNGLSSLVQYFISTEAALNSVNEETDTDIILIDLFLIHPMIIEFVKQYLRYESTTLKYLYNKHNMIIKLECNTPSTDHDYYIEDASQKLMLVRRSGFSDEILSEIAKLEQMCLQQLPREDQLDIDNRICNGDLVLNTDNPMQCAHIANDLLHILLLELHMLLPDSKHQPTHITQ